MNKYTAALAAALLAVSAPALADEDERHYQANKHRYISYQKAGQIAATRVKGSVENVDFEYSKRRGAYFDVDVRGRDGRDYDVKVNARTGRIMSVRADD